jgi:hypothetical protein
LSPNYTKSNKIYVSVFQDTPLQPIYHTTFIGNWELVTLAHWQHSATPEALRHTKIKLSKKASDKATDFPIPFRAVPTRIHLP